MKETLRQLWKEEYAPLHFHVTDFSNATFCEQVLAMSNTNIAVMHHGAAVAGNLFFLPPSGTCIIVEHVYRNVTPFLTADH